jgi:hypothetical protein
MLPAERMFLLLQADSFESPWLQGFHSVVGSRCNDLPQAGYKQVFDS